MLAFVISASRMQTKGYGAIRGMSGGARASLTMLLAALSVAWVPAVYAGRLGTHACYELRVELGFLRAAGAEEDMKRGPDWAKVNLTSKELENVRRLVEVEEQLRFRCGSLRGRLIAKKPRIPDIPQRKPASAKAPAQKKAPAVQKADAQAPTKKASTSIARRRASLRRKKRRSRAKAALPNDTVTNGLTPYGGFQ